MNFLAHAYLSFGRPGLLVGNMISDFVKGKKKYDYAADILQGINLHRQIDSFTDLHQATREAAALLKPAAARYAGAFVDVVYDHFLANDSDEFTEQTLQMQAQMTYGVLNDYLEVLPHDFKQMLPYMQSQNWLYNYRSMTGARNSFGGVARRALYINSSAEIFDLFQTHYSSLQKCYKTFFPSVKAFTLSQIDQLAYK